MSEIDKKPIFLLAPTADGKPLLMFIVPETAYNDAPNGWSFPFDLTAVGLPIRVSIVKAKDHADGMAQIEAIAKQKGIPILDQRRKDFSGEGQDNG